MISEMPVTRSEGSQFPSCQLRVQKVKVADLEPEATISGKEKQNKTMKSRSGQNTLIIPVRDNATVTTKRLINF